MATKRSSAKEWVYDTTADPVVITGSEGKNELEGTAGVDHIYGLGGDDVLRGRAGDDELRGGSGNDRLYGQTGRDVLRGQSGDDQLYGGYDIDHLYGNTGRDTLDGGNGADVMIGGRNEDSYFVDNEGDTIVELAEEDEWDDVTSSVSYTLSAHVEQLILSGTADINGTGNEQKNYLDGNEGNNILSGGGGDDSFFGNGGDDTLIGGTGNDDFYVWTGSFGNVTIVEEAGGGIDMVHIAALAYTLGANLENVFVIGAWDQASLIHGNELDNEISLDSTNHDSEVWGHGGNDVLYTSGKGAYGGDGDDSIETYGDYAHVLDGGAGNDILLGGWYATYIGGEGADHFRIESGFMLYSSDLAPTIADFEQGIDTVELGSWLFDEDEAFTEQNFYAGSGGQAQTAEHRILFDTDTGWLYYDPDGTGTQEDIRVLALIHGDNVTFNDIAVTEFL